VTRSGLHVHLYATAPIPLDLTLTCAPGELLALVGPSGSGKTTILRCIAGLHHPTRGHITCDGATWLDTPQSIDLPPQQRRIGLVFQGYALFPHMTALGNVAAALGHLPSRERAAHATAMLAQVGLEGLEGRRPAGLSGGQQQRVALARALARDPTALLLDEPFSAVDRPTRRELYRVLASLRERLAIPAVLVTHDLGEAVRLADRMAVLHQGRVLQQGAPDDVAARPDDALVARLLDVDELQPAVVIDVPSRLRRTRQ
jgi:molybdate transport system ATP-binding protein